jgi:hypothetical protein
MDKTRTDFPEQQDIVKNAILKVIDFVRAHPYLDRDHNEPLFPYHPPEPD